MIKFENVDFGYKRGRLVFSDLNMKLEQGKIYGLLGKNGAGKTTLLKLSCGLLFPKGGDIDVMGNKPKDRKVEFLGDIFFVPEEFIMPPMTPLDYASSYSFAYPHFNIDLFASLLDRLVVNPNEMMNKMSFGQQKKSYIAFAIACNTKILVMDEPTNGLDIPSKSAFRRIISSEMNDGRTIIISTHQVRDLDQLIDTVVILDRSKILLNASINEIAGKLHFKHISEGEEAVYSEQTIHGKWGAVINNDNSESQVDMEILFNAAMNNPQYFINIFNH